jgi:two-component system, OmpR family, sensor histidine kinase TctE
MIEPRVEAAPIRRASIRRRLTLPIIASLVVFFAFDAYILYRDTLRSINIAYDRTLLASARAIGDGVKYAHETLSVSLPYPALEVFEADVRSRMVFRVSDFEGGFLAGYADLPPHKGKIDDNVPYAALVTFYEDRFQNETVRVAALLQPVSTGTEYKMVTVQVAETLELRKSIVQQVVVPTIWRQLAIVCALAAVVWFVIGRALKPLLRLRDEILERSADSVEPLSTKTSRELLPVVDAMNEVMRRLHRILENRQRFVRDASHQLRTPLAALKIQVQNAREGLIEPYVALAEIEGSVDRATRVANQMLALAKVAELGEDETQLDSARTTTDLVAACRDIAVECSPLISEKRLDFALDGDCKTAQPVRGSDWMLREMLRNLLSNAIRYAPSEGSVGFVIEQDASERRLYVWDSGSGIDETQKPKLFRAFSTGDRESGTGLGLVICRDICRKIGATLTLANRSDLTNANLPSAATGCIARIVFPS